MPVVILACPRRVAGRPAQADAPRKAHHTVGKQKYLAAMNEAGFRDVVVSETSYAGQAMIAALDGKIISLQIRARK